MAAELGVAASVLGIAGVAAQLGSGIIKIKNFCKDVKNAPEELLDTIASVENFSKILARLGEGQTRDMYDMKNGDNLRESLNLCKKAADRIATLAIKLELQMQLHSRWGAVKIVLKKDTVNMMLQRLHCSKVDLHLAYTMYSDACTQRKLDSIIHYQEKQQEEHMYIVSSTSTVVQYQSATDDEILYPTLKQGSTKWRGQAYHAEEWLHETRIRLPLWLCRYAWDVAFINACGRWTFSFKSFKVIHWDHPAYAMATKDDVDGIRALLERRELSVHDKLAHGKSLLDHAIEWNSPSVAHLLTCGGAIPTRGHWRMWRSGARFLQDGSRFKNSSADFFESARYMARLILNVMQSDVPHNPLLLEAMSKSDGCWTADERLELMDCVWTRAGVHARSFFRILGTEKISATLCNSHYDGKNALHVLAENCLVSYLDTDSRHMWISAVQRHMADPAILHGRYRQNHWNVEITPFASILNHTFDEIRRFDERGEQLVRLWARCVSEAGIDVVSYGEREHKLLHEQKPLYDWFSGIWGFMEFTYGPDPKDWHVWMRHSGDLYAGMFWELVESERQQLPGAWIEEEEDDDVPRFDLWRQGYGARRIGIKRKALRRGQR